jgi:uncharacterized damage-inducible protein DinB
MNPETLQILYDYHYWRTDRLLDACQALTPQQWDEPLGASWGSVHALLAHMLAAEQIWLGRWKGHSAGALMPADSVPTLAAIRRTWKQVEDELREFLAACDEARLKADLTYTNTKGKKFSLPLGGLMMHVVDHATHHRGELVTMLSLLAIPHPEDGLNGYLIERSES